MIPGHYLFLQDDLLRRCGTNHFSAPAQMRWPPGGLAGIAYVMPQPEGLKAH